MHLRAFFGAVAEMRAVTEMRSGAHRRAMAAFRPSMGTFLIIVAFSLTKVLTQLVCKPAKLSGFLIGEAGGKIIHGSLSAVLDEFCFCSSEVGEADMREALVRFVFLADYKAGLDHAVDQFSNRRGTDVELLA